MEELTLNIRENIELLSSQFNIERTPVFNKLVSEILNYYQNELINPTLYIINNYNINKATNFLLDWIATRINIERFSQGVPGVYFGFRGSSGKSFSQAPFWSHDVNLRELRQRIGDDVFRPILKMLFQRLFTASTYESIERNMKLIFDTFILEDLQNGTINISFGLTERENILFNIIKDYNLFTAGAGIQVKIPVNKYKSYAQNILFNKILTVETNSSFVGDSFLFINGVNITSIGFAQDDFLIAVDPKTNPFPKDNTWSIYLVSENDNLEIPSTLLSEFIEDFGEKRLLLFFSKSDIRGLDDFINFSMIPGQQVQFIVADQNSLEARNL